MDKSLAIFFVVALLVLTVFVVGGMAKIKHAAQNTQVLMVR